MWWSQVGGAMPKCSGKIGNARAMRHTGAIALDGRRPRPLFRDAQNLATICLKIGIMNLRGRK
jgi:hypothetical protein